MGKARRYPLIELREALIQAIKDDQYWMDYLAKDEHNEPIIYNHSMEDRKSVTCPCLAVATDFEYDRAQEQNQMPKRDPDIWIEVAEEGEHMPTTKENAYKKGEDIIQTLERNKNLSGLVSNFLIVGFKHLGQRKDASGHYVQAYKMPISCILI